MQETGLYGEVRGFIPGALRVNESMVFYFKDMGKSFFRPLEISLDILHHLCLPMEAFITME